MDHEATGLAFESMFPFVIVDPCTGDPGNALRFGRVWVFRLDRLDDFGHSSLLTEPAKIVFWMRKRVTYRFGEKIKRRRMHLEIKYPIVQAVMIRRDQSIDVV